jgi:hypothetical protein
MKKNIIFIGGAVALLGAGAFIYFKNKNKPNTSSDLSKPSILDVSAEQSKEEAIEIKQGIKDLASSIQSHRDAILAHQKFKKDGIRVYPSITWGALRRKADEKITAEQNSINSHLAKLKELGYTELNGILVKLSK